MHGSYFYTDPTVHYIYGSYMLYYTDPTVQYIYGSYTCCTVLYRSYSAVYLCFLFAVLYTDPTECESRPNEGTFIIKSCPVSPDLVSAKVALFICYSQC